MSAFSVAEGETRSLPWWLFLIEGIALVILGILWLANPAATTVAFVWAIGLYWLVGGLFKIVSIFLDHSMWGWKLIAGILGIVAGIIVMQHPLWSPIIVGATLIIILGIQGIIFGGIGIYQAFKGAGWAAGIMGAISVIFGIYLLANVGAATFVLPWVLGILAIVGGIVTIVMAFRQRSA
jgi:uncharacterized membrane protein HdeD (DUF308 family)